MQRLFYKQIGADAEKMRFYAVCPVCGSRQYSKKIPLLCRNLEKLALYETGTADGMRQSSYLRAKASVSMELAQQFNFCRRCKRWVCDDCFVLEEDGDVCKACSDKTASGTK